MTESSVDVWIDEIFPGRVAKLYGAMTGMNRNHGRWEILPWFTIAQTKQEYAALGKRTMGNGPFAEWVHVEAYKLPDFFVIATPTPERFEGWQRPEAPPPGSPEHN